MGEYYKWVNIDKKEYIDPFSFDYGGKILNSSGCGNHCLRALYELLSEEWQGDRILFLGDYFELPEDPQSGVFKTVYEQAAKAGQSTKGFIFDFIEDYYRDVSCLFKAAEPYVKEGIDNDIEHIKNGDSFGINRYRIDPENPYEGLFLKEGRDFRFTVNHTKKVCYSSDSVRLFIDETEESGLDPLPLLLACGDTSVLGPWLGDIIGVSDEIPEGYVLLKEFNFEW